MLCDMLLVQHFDDCSASLYFQGNIIFFESEFVLILVYIEFSFYWSCWFWAFRVCLHHHHSVQMQILREGEEKNDNIGGSQCPYNRIEALSGTSWNQRWYFIPMLQANSYFSLLCLIFSLVNLESSINLSGSQRSWTWHHIWVELVINHPYTGFMGWLFTWMSWMLHFLVTMCAMSKTSRTSGSKLMTAQYVLYLNMQCKFIWLFDMFFLKLLMLD